MGQGTRGRALPVVPFDLRFGGAIVGAVSRLPSPVAKLIPVVTLLVLVCVGLGLFSSGRPDSLCVRSDLEWVPAPSTGNLPPGYVIPRSGRSATRESVCKEEIEHAAPFNEGSTMWWFFGAGAIVLIGLSLIPTPAGGSRPRPSP